MPELKKAELPLPPERCRDRLLNHYGSGVSDWFASVPERLAKTARQWYLVPTEYHDAGHASVLLLADTSSGERALLKAWPDSERCVRETSALRLWTGLPAARVLQVDGERSIAALSLVGGRPGGGARAVDDAQQIAQVIQNAHSRGSSLEGRPEFPALSDYLAQEVRRSVARRMKSLAPADAGPLLQAGWRALESLTPAAHRRTVLHGDLYQENTACDGYGRPHLLDPLPMYGDAAYDWAFWSVYYRLGQGMGERLVLASLVSGIKQRELRSWCLAICLHGLLYYQEIADSRYTMMEKVMGSLLPNGENAR